VIWGASIDDPRFSWSAPQSLNERSIDYPLISKNVNVFQDARDSPGAPGFFEQSVKWSLQDSATAPDFSTRFLMRLRTKPCDPEALLVKSGPDDGYHRTVESRAMNEDVDDEGNR
jgi:hypothetical protein